MTQRNWTHNELLVAYNLYCRLPFGQLNSHNPHIIQLASLIDRSPSAVSMKLCNFASLDPIHQARGVKGLANVSAADKDIIAEFNSNWTDSVNESSELLANLTKRNLEIKTEVKEPTGSTDVERTIRQRRGQDFFRQAVLTAYDMQCCISGIPMPQLLIASHILPWSSYPHERLNPCNGLCLSSLYDTAFDRGLITFDDKYRLVLSTILKKTAYSTPLLHDAFIVHEGNDIKLPNKFLPDQSFLQVHRNSIFLT